MNCNGSPRWTSIQPAFWTGFWKLLSFCSYTGDIQFPIRIVRQSCSFGVSIVHVFVGALAQCTASTRMATSRCNWANPMAAMIQLCVDRGGVKDWQVLTFSWGNHARQVGLSINKLIKQRNWEVYWQSYEANWCKLYNFGFLMEEVFFLASSSAGRCERGQ